MIQNKTKLIRITTSSESLDKLLIGQLKFLSQYFEVIGIASGYKNLQLIEKREGIRTIDLKMNREINIFKDIYSLIRMVQILYKEKPHIVHSNTPKSSLISMVAAWICRVPHRIYTVTGLRFETTTGLFRKLLIIIERITCFFATIVIPEGEGVKNVLIGEHITKKKLSKILNGNINGIDLLYFNSTIYSSEYVKTLRGKYNIGENDFVFIFVGRLVKDKGINELISAFEKICKNNNHGKNQVKLLLVGSTEPKLDPLSPITLEKIKDNTNILATGFQDDVRPFMVMANALILPSYREGFPNSVLQAGAMGLPAIVTDISGSNEIIISGKNGIIVSPKNEIELYDGMCHFLDNRESIDKMAENAREMIASRFDQKKVWEAILLFYNNLEE